MHALQERPEPTRGVVVRNEQNVGLPAGCNQGIAQPRGRHLLFLNNDTVVTPHWLERLVGWVLHDWPTVGMAGAVSNYSAEPQQGAVDYANLSGLDGFAVRRAEEFAGKGLFVPVLKGFCLLGRLRQVGGFDERNGLGLFDDDDFKVCVQAAGYKLVVGQDVFIHHFGSRIFKSLEVDCRKQLRENLELFNSKWGAYLRCWAGLRKRKRGGARR